MRHVYRTKFKLSAQEMDDEPILEVQMHFAMWKLEDKRRRAEEKKAQRKNKGTNG